MSETKKKAAKQSRELKKTVGGAPPVDLTPLEESVIGIIGNTPIDGIPGGIDVGGDRTRYRNPRSIQYVRIS